MPQTEVRAFKIKGKVPLVDWLERLRTRERKAYIKCLAKIKRLEAEGYALDRPENGFLGEGIYELRIQHRHVNYRILYFFYGKDIACMTHGLTKEAEIPEKDIVYAKDARKLVESDAEKYTAEWEI